jgi:hypothetical protein
VSGPVEPQAGRDVGVRSTAVPLPTEGPVTRARDGDDAALDGQAEEDAAGEAAGVEQAADAPAASGPDPFRLRARPPQVMRLSRRAVAIIGLGLGLGLGGSLIWALKSAAPKIAPNLYDTASSAKPGVVSSAPTDYSQVTPRLGPRMVGDLGRPFLAAQQRGSNAVGAGSGAQGGMRLVARVQHRVRPPRSNASSAFVRKAMRLAPASSSSGMPVAIGMRQRHQASRLRPARRLERLGWAIRRYRPPQRLCRLRRPASVPLWRPLPPQAW